MKTRTDLMNLLHMICDFYNCNREVLGLTHEEASYKIELMYNDFYEWLYEEGDFNK